MCLGLFQGEVLCRDDSFYFGVELLVFLELFHGLRENRDEPWVDVEFRTDYGEDSRNVREASEIELAGEVSRGWSALAFVDMGWCGE